MKFSDSRTIACVHNMKPLHHTTINLYTYIPPCNGYWHIYAYFNLHWLHTPRLWHCMYNSASLFGLCLPASSYSTLTCIGCWFSSGWCNWRNWHWLSPSIIFRLSTSLLSLTIGSWLSSLLCLPGSILPPDVRREVVLEHVTADLPQLLLKLLISAMKYNCVCCRGLSG